MFAKLFSSITESSLWSEPKEVRLLFVTMLAKADQNGFVEASIPGLARVSNLTIEETERSLECLQGPDAYSKNPDNEGRRVLQVPGGFVLLNYEDYRSRRSTEERREYMREYMKDYRKKDDKPRKQRVNKRKHQLTSVNQGKPPLAQAETETETETETEGKESVKEKPAMFTAYTPGPDIVVPPRLNHPEIIDAIGSWIRFTNKRDPDHKIFLNSDEEQALYRFVNSWAGSTAAIVTRILEAVGNRWRTLRAPDAPLHQNGEAATTDLEDTWDALTTFIGKIPPGETYTDRITAKFGSKVATLVKKFGYNEIRTADQFEDAKLKKRFVREMQS